MHPILSRPSWLALYLGAWIPVAALFGLALHYLAHIPAFEAWADANGLCAVLAFVCLAAWYPARAQPIAKAGTPGFLLTHVTAALFSSAMWLVIGRGWVAALERIPGWQGAGARYNALFPGLFLVGILFYALSAAVHYLAAVVAASRLAEQRALELLVQAREAELRALRAQIDPHFLFNSLNSISALTSSDPASARRMCIELADFLRRTLVLGQRERIPLSEELDLAEGYLRVEQVRFGSRLRVERDVDEPALSAAVPPLLLQPLVENAVRHGIAQRLEGGTIRIEAKCEGARLRVSVSNPRDPDGQSRPGAGVGLRNVAGRLRTLFGADARLDATAGADSYLVRLELPAGESS
ncbi:MAG TPA: histidine kinase [Candidatus Eisenbacteria bacterium]|nr:histidine kinase [Candidatus Eisenbacteria bacterium]